jgi:hypothetical protein
MTATLNTVSHKVEITEGALAKFLTWIFTFWPFGQLRAVKGKINYELGAIQGGGRGDHPKAAEMR